MYKTSQVNLSSSNILTVNNDLTIGEDSTDLVIVNNTISKFMNNLNINGDINITGNFKQNEIPFARSNSKWITRWR